MHELTPDVPDHQSIVAIPDHQSTVAINLSWLSEEGTLELVHYDGGWGAHHQRNPKQCTKWSQPKSSTV